MACCWTVGRAPSASSPAALVWPKSGRLCAGLPVCGSHTYMQTTMQDCPGDLVVPCLQSASSADSSCLQQLFMLYATLGHCWCCCLTTNQDFIIITFLHTSHGTATDGARNLVRSSPMDLVLCSIASLLSRYVVATMHSITAHTACRN